MTQLESQPSSAAAENKSSTRNPGVQQLVDAKQNTASAATMQGHSGKARDVSPRQQSEPSYGHGPQQRRDTGKEKQTEEVIDMQELIDLTADSDAEPEALD